MKFIVSPNTIGAMHYLLVEFIADIKCESIYVRCAVSNGFIIDYKGDFSMYSAS